MKYAYIRETILGAMEFPAWMHGRILQAINISEQERVLINLACLCDSLGISEKSVEEEISRRHKLGIESLEKNDTITLVKGLIKDIVIEKWPKADT